MNGGQKELVKFVFGGKKNASGRTTNEQILNLFFDLSADPETDRPLNKNKIAENIGIGFGTVQPRVNALKEKDLLETKDPAGKLYTISPKGLWVLAHNPSKTQAALVLERCEKVISERWNTFSKLYHLDKVKTEEMPAHELLTDWLKEEGLLDFLDTFEGAPLRSETEAFIVFRRMIDLAMLDMHTGYRMPVFTSRIELADWSINPSEALAEIITSHKLLSRVNDALRVADAPLYAYINKDSVEKLRQFLPRSVGDKLAENSFFDGSDASAIGDALRYTSIESLSTAMEIMEKLVRSRKHEKGMLQIPSFKIVRDGEKVCILTEDPESISAKWKEYCYLYVPRKEGNKVLWHRAPARRNSR